MFKLPNLFRRTPDLTLTEEFGTPWAVYTEGNTKPQHPEDTAEAVLYMIDTIWPTLDKPVTLIHERLGVHGGIHHDILTVVGYAQALTFVHEHTAA